VYDASDAITRIEDTRRGIKKYHYDACDRLVRVDAANPESFVIDPAGNILSSNGGQGVALGDRLLVHDDRRFEYDEHGNRVKEFRVTEGVRVECQYGPENELVKVTEHGIERRATRFAYDALGRRCWKESGGDRTPEGATRVRFLWNGHILLAESEDNNRPLATLYVYEPETFRPLAQVRDDDVHLYHLDRLGTPQDMTDECGKLVWSADLNAWGQVRVQYISKLENRLRFQGQYADFETGLHYNRFRYYSPGQGCFITQDRIRLLGGDNLAAYAPNPVCWVDPFGLVNIGVGNEGNVRVHAYPGPPAGGDEHLPLHAHLYEGRPENPDTPKTRVLMEDYTKNGQTVGRAGEVYPDDPPMTKSMRRAVRRNLPTYERRTREVYSTGGCT
jgi:RHS repeat-associated protein